MRKLTAKDKGKWFSAKICGEKCIGRIQLEKKNFYLCQDQESGECCNNMLGFNYSWTVYEGSVKKLKEENVSYLKIYTKKPKGFFRPATIKLNDRYTAIVKKNYVEVGCQKIPNSAIIQLYKSLSK